MGNEMQLVTFGVADIQAMAAAVAKSRLFGLDEAQAFTLMLLAQSEGTHPIKAVQRYHVIQGRPAMKADAMLADFQRLGGTVEWLTESDDREKCEAVFRHPVHAPNGKTIRFGMNDAKAAGLAGKDIWKQYPASMMRARVVSIGIRMIAPGIVAGLYTPEEVGDFGKPIEVESRPVPEHHAINHDNQTGHGSGAYADPEVVKQFAVWADNQCEEVNTKWCDFLTDKHGEVRQGPSEIVNVWQLSGHLIKWGRTAMGLNAPEEIRAGSRDKYAAVLWQRDQTAVIDEATKYCRRCWRDAKAKLAPSDAEQVAAENAALDQMILTTEAGARG